MVDRLAGRGGDQVSRARQLDLETRESRTGDPDHALLRGRRAAGKGRKV
jgi:hypothetical protein